MSRQKLWFVVILILQIGTVLYALKQFFVAFVVLSMNVPIVLIINEKLLFGHRHKWKFYDKNGKEIGDPRFWAFDGFKRVCACGKHQHYEERGWDSEDWIDDEEKRQ